MLPAKTVFPGEYPRIIYWFDQSYQVFFLSPSSSPRFLPAFGFDIPVNYTYNLEDGAFVYDDLFLTMGRRSAYFDGLPFKVKSE